jgi:hypothetical protein
LASASICSQIKEDDKRKAAKHNPIKLEEQTLPKSINHSAAKYPSQPGVEGVQIHPRVTPARGTPPEEGCRKERKRIQA